MVALAVLACVVGCADADQRPADAAGDAVDVPVDKPFVPPDSAPDVAVEVKPDVGAGETGPPPPAWKLRVLSDTKIGGPNELLLPGRLVRRRNEWAVPIQTAQGAGYLRMNRAGVEIARQVPIEGFWFERDTLVSSGEVYGLVRQQPSSTFALANAEFIFPSEGAPLARGRNRVLWANDAFRVVSFQTYTSDRGRLVLYTLGPDGAVVGDGRQLDEGKTLQGALDAQTLFAHGDTVMGVFTEIDPIGKAVGYLLRRYEHALSKSSLADRPLVGEVPTPRRQPPSGRTFNASAVRLTNVAQGRSDPDLDVTSAIAVSGGDTDITVFPWWDESGDKVLRYNIVRSDGSLVGDKTLAKTTWMALGAAWDGSKFVVLYTDSLSYGGSLWVTAVLAEGDPVTSPVRLPVQLRGQPAGASLAYFAMDGSEYAVAYWASKCAECAGEPRLLRFNLLPP